MSRRGVVFSERKPQLLVKITACAIHPPCHYFCYSLNSSFSLIKPNQVRPAAGKRDLLGAACLLLVEPH